MKKTICDYCGEEIREPFPNYRGDLDVNTLAALEIKPIFLKRTVDTFKNPDLCRKCIIKILEG